METKYFSLSELVHAREWLMFVMNSTQINVPLTRENLKNARVRLREIDQELTDRLMGTKWQEPFEDE